MAVQCDSVPFPARMIDIFRSDSPLVAQRHRAAPVAVIAEELHAQILTSMPATDAGGYGNGNDAARGVPRLQ
jgi:hypothetical protein